MKNGVKFLVGGGLLVGGLIILIVLAKGAFKGSSNSTDRERILEAAREAKAAKAALRAEEKENENLNIETDETSNS